MDGFSFSAEKLSSMISRSHSGCIGGDYSATWVEELELNGGTVDWPFMLCTLRWKGFVAYVLIA